MIEPGRKYLQGSNKYRYGFNGKEKDNEVKGEGNQQDYGMRPYDDRLGRLISVDPLTNEYPNLTPYQFAENNPIENIDLLGMQGQPVTGTVTPTIPTLRPMSSWQVNPVSNYTPLVSTTPINGGAYAAGAAANGTLHLSYEGVDKEKIESMLPASAYFAEIKSDGTGYALQGEDKFGHFSYPLYTVHSNTPYKSLAELFKYDAKAAKAEEYYKLSIGVQNFKNTIYTDKVTPLVLNPLNTFQRITTDVSNLKAQDILDLKDRIIKGTATDQDKIHAAALIKARLDYQINLKHVTASGNASKLPANHTELWDNRTIYDTDSDTYWSIEGKGKKAVFHRFSGDGNGSYHWSGSTGRNLNRKGNAVKPLDKSVVPNSVKQKAGYKKG
jgi:RHS repeat-associated protein